MIDTSTDKRVENNVPEASFRQAMAWLHTWVGLTLSWLLFFIFLTGTAGYFDTEIDRWMQPELPRAKTHLDTTATTVVMLDRLHIEAPGAKRWQLMLPVDRTQPYPTISWRGAAPEAGAGSGTLVVDAKTGAPLVARATEGGQHLYQMHWRLHYLPRDVSDIVVGLATLFMLIALISGIIIHKKIFKDFFTFRPGKGQRSWLDAHNILSVTALPFHLMITYSGLVFMTLSYMPMIKAAHYGTDSQAQQRFIADAFGIPGLVEQAGQRAALAPLDNMIAQAEQRWGKGRIRAIDIRHPQYSNARVIISEHIEKALGSRGERLVFGGTDGALLHIVTPDATTAKGVREVLIGLHEGLFAPPLLRWLYFVSGLLGTAMIATGLVLWANKRRRLAQQGTGIATPGLILVEKLNVGTVVGLPTAIATYFWANRLLPVSMANRAEWEAHILFISWFLLLSHAALRPLSRAWPEQLTLAALAFALLPLLNAATSGRHLLHSLTTGDWVFAGFDLTMLAIGLALALVASYNWQKYHRGAGTIIRAGIEARRTALGKTP